MKNNRNNAECLMDDKWTYEFRDNEEYRWCLNYKEQKKWYKKNKIDGEWEYYDVVGLIYHLSNPYDYCVQCGNKSVRLSFAEISRKSRELGIYRDDEKLCWEYDKKRYEELGLLRGETELERQCDIPHKRSFDDMESAYFWECVNGCKITHVPTDFYELKKDMVDERIKRGLSVDEIDTKAINNRKKQKELEQVSKENMKIWDKFF